MYTTTSTRRRWRVVALLFVAVVMLAVTFVVTNTKAYANVHQLEPASSTPASLSVTHAGRLHRGHLWAELSDGSVWRFSRCRYEDSANCWWDATRRGDRTGQSFANLRGVSLRIPTRLLR